MAGLAKKERAVGAIIGTLIGDALGVGPHWYYDLEELKKDYGEWIRDYLPPKDDRYHAGLEAGQNSQTGQVTAMLLESVAEKGGYDQDDFTKRLDELLSLLDGTPKAGRYTDQAMRDVWRQRHDNLPWDKCGSYADTCEAAVRAPILAARYRGDLKSAFDNLVSNIPLTHRDPFIAGRSAGFGLIVWALINGVPFANTTNHITHKTAKAGFSLAWPVTVDGREESCSFHDVILHPRWAADAAKKLTVEPAVLLPLLAGMACAFDSLLTSAFYYAARFEGDFEMAVLTAINSGGNNMARASLTGALVGAQVGLEGMPRHFIEGLADYQRLIELAEKIAGAGE